MSVAVILSVDGNRDNMLSYSKIFDAELLEALKFRVNAVTPLEQIPIYADFIKSNIDMLMQYDKQVLIIFSIEKGKAT